MMETPWKVIVAFVGVFIAGAVFGGFFTLGMAEWWKPEPAAPAPAAVAPTTAGPAAAPRKAQPGQSQLLQIPQTWQAPQLMRRYAERLNLTPEQKERIMPLIQRASADYRRVQQDTFRDTGFILRRLQQDIAKELTPEQRESLRRMEERQAEALKKMEQRQRDQKQRKTGGQKKADKAAQPAAPAEPAQNAPNDQPATEKEPRIEVTPAP